MSVCLQRTPCERQVGISKRKEIKLDSPSPYSPKTPLCPCIRFGMKSFSEVLQYISDTCIIFVIDVAVVRLCSQIVFFPDLGVFIRTCLALNRTLDINMPISRMFKIAMQIKYILNKVFNGGCKPVEHNPVLTDLQKLLRSKNVVSTSPLSVV